MRTLSRSDYDAAVWLTLKAGRCHVYVVAMLGSFCCGLEESGMHRVVFVSVHQLTRAASTFPEFHLADLCQVAQDRFLENIEQQW